MKNLKKLFAVLGLATVVGSSVMLAGCSSSIEGEYKFQEMRYELNGTTTTQRIGDKVDNVTLTEESIVLILRDDEAIVRSYAEYEGEDKPLLYEAPRQYALGQSHKHLPEIKAVCGLDVAPLFCPIVADFPCGMEVSVPIFKKDLNGSIDDVKETYKKLYVGDVVKFNDSADESGFLSASLKSGKDSMEISVFGNEDRILLVSRFDNLGKGASGAAIQNMNIILGVEETTGLVL